MKEIGSFIELEFQSGKEYHNEIKYGKNNIIRLNTCRAAIYHAIRCYNVNKVYLPLYECDSVSNFLKRHNIEISLYEIDEEFIPKIDNNEKDSAIVFSNYYGIMSEKHFNKFINKFNNVIIDNAQSFFSNPIENCINTYSCRKFVGVPDGSYAIGDNVNKFEYEKDFSSNTSLFLLQRIEYGCEGKAYLSRKDNEDRIDNSDIKIMSSLTSKILDGIDYDKNKEIRKNNFAYARKLFDEINMINIDCYVDENTIPMVYPLLISKDIINNLKDNKMFQGHWWEYIVDITNENQFENFLSKYIIPITIDQRYSCDDIEYQYKVVKENL